MSEFGKSDALGVSPAVDRYVRTRSQTRASRRSSLPSYLVILSLGYLFLLDTPVRDFIPGAMLLRGFVLVILVVLWVRAWTAPVSRSTASVLWLAAAFAVVGSGSVVVSVAPLLAGLKLAVYVVVMVTLLHPGIPALFGPDTTALWRLSQLSLLILVVNLLLLPTAQAGATLGMNFMGGLGPLVFPLMLFNAYLPAGKRKRLGRLGLVLCVVTVLLSGARGPTFSIYVMFVCHYLFRRTRSGGLAVVTAAVVCAASLTVAIMVAKCSEHVYSYVYKDKVEFLLTGERKRMFWECVDAIEDRPLLGYGFGISHRVTPDALDDFLRTGRLSGTVGELGSSTMGLLVGGGVVLLAAFAALIAGIVNTGLKAMYSGRAERGSYELLRALVAGILGLVVGAQTENGLLAPMQYGVIQFWLFCGIILYVSASVARRAPPRFGLKSPAAAHRSLLSPEP